MAGVSDQPFRNLCRANGAHWLVSEMVTSDQRLWHTRKSANRLRFQDEPGPRWVQIAGADPMMLAEAATVNQGFGADFIDINMGCPAKKVCNKAAGSALLRDEKLVAQILKAVVAAVTVPVTLKIRLGWSRDEINATKIAHIAEQEGVQLLTVHGRTRACKFQGEVDYEAIRQVVEAVNIPVVANGDIDTEIKAQQVLQRTGAAALMVGRAIQGRPWLASQIDHYLGSGQFKKKPESSEIKRQLVAHLNCLSSFYGEVMGPRIARKHVGWYFGKMSDFPSRRSFIKHFNTLVTLTEQLEAINMIFNGIEINAVGTFS
ncbi:MAG: tRNA dihydrouridine synthase DusB [Pseudomonadales bacterium]|nr:tRNA dihydrouridine synthase DusB [Pseudomonadales bacterium]